MDDNVIRDFFFKLGFDGEDVLKGLKSVQKEFTTLQKNLNKIATVQNKNSLMNQRQTNREIALEKQKLAIRKTLATLKDEGFSTGRLNVHQALQSNDPVKLAKALSKAEESLHNHRIMQKNVARELNDEIAKGDAIEQAKLLKIKEQEEVQKRIALEAKKQNDYQMQLRRKYVGLTKNRDNFASDVGNQITRIQGKESAFAGKEGAAEYKRITSQLNRLQFAAKSASADGLVDLRRQFKRLNIESSEFIKKNKAVVNSLLSGRFAANSMKDSMRNLARSYASVFAIVGGAGMAINQGMKIESSKISLITGTGSLQNAAEEYQFVNEQAKKYGLNLAESVKAYGRIQAGAKMANMSVAETRELFDGLNIAAVGFSLTSDEMTGIFKAITDSLSKGTLMAEELKGQLGDRMPVAVGAMAQALKVTTPELMKMMERGELIATEVLPKLAKGLKAMAVDSGGFAAGMKTSNKEMARFGTTFQMNMAKMFDAGAESGLAGFFRNLTGIMEYMSPLFRIVGKVLGTTVEVLSALALAAYQVIRPVAILFETLIAGADDGTKSVGVLMRAFYLLLAAILTPFVWLEKFNNALAESGPIAKTSLAVIAIYLSKVLGKFFFMNGFLGKALTSVGSLTKAFSLFGVVAKGVLTAISRHPVIATLLAISSVVEYLSAATRSPEGVAGRNNIQNTLSGRFGLDKEGLASTSLTNIKSTFDIIRAGLSSMVGTDILNASPNLRNLYSLADMTMGQGVTYNINVTTPDTEAAIRTLEPYLENKLTTWGTDVAKSSMAPGEN